LASHTHTPELLHSRPPPQGWQALPLIPQVVLFEVWHWPFLSQQPVEQDWASHTQEVPLQRCPGEHVLHPPPPFPQAAGISLVMHVLLLQQPLGQEVASQTHLPAALHSSPLAQGLQATPPMPQVVVDDVWHWPLESQQPFGHEVASQTHFPCALHSCFVPHGVHATPLRPQLVLPEVRH
jgi:hypothetical protein